MPIPENPTSDSIKPVLESLPKPYVPVLTANVADKNGRVYTSECLERAVAYFQKRVNERTALVHYMDRSHRHDFTNAVGYVKDAHFDGENVNVSVSFTSKLWKMISKVTRLSFSVEATCVGSGSEITCMEICSLGVHREEVKRAK
jgi:hypothetical protein